jgi:hypothetical protein
VAYINADTTLDGLGINLIADRSGFEKTLATINYTVSANNGISNTTGALSTAGDIWYTYNDTETGNTTPFSTTAGGTAVSNIRAALMDGLVAGATGAGKIGAVAGNNGNQMILTRMISGGSTTDRSPLSTLVNVTPLIDDAQTSTTAKFLTGNVSNNAAKTSGNFAFSVTETELMGMRVTLRNVGSVAFSSAVSLYGAAVSNTAIITNATSGVTPNGMDSLLAEGRTIATWSATANGSVADYMTGYTDIVAGTTTTSTAAVTAVTTNRTGW